MMSLAKVIVTVCLAASIAVVTRAQTAELVVQTGHTGSIRSIAVSHDRRLIASAADDKTAKIWDLATGRELRTITGVSGTILFRPGDRTLATENSDGTVKLWDVVTGKQTATTPPPESENAWVESIAFSSSGKFLATSERNGRIVILDAASLREIAAINTGHEVGPKLAFSPTDERLLASSDEPHNIKLWDVRTGKLVGNMTGNSADEPWLFVNKIVFSPDGKEIATIALFDGLVRLWNVASGAERKVFGRDFSVSSLAFTPDGKQFVTAAENTIRYWDAVTAIEIESLRKVTKGPIRDFIFLGDEESMAAVIWKEIAVWDASSTPRMIGHGVSTEGRVTLVSPNEKILAVAGRKVILWSLSSKSGVVMIDGSPGYGRPWAFSPDGRLMAIGRWISDGADGEIEIRDTESGKVLWTLTGHTGPVFSVSFSPSGKQLASGGFDLRTRLWNLETGGLERVLTAPGDKFPVESFEAFLASNEEPDHVRAVAFTPDGKSVARATDNALLVWNVTTGAVEHSLLKDLSFSELAFSPDGHIVVGVVKESGRVVAWNLRSEKELHNFENSFANREALRKIAPMLAFTEAVTEKFVISVEENDKVKIRDRVSRKELATLVGFTDGGWVVVTPDGLFDASPEARRRMHYVLGLEVVTLEQMKDVYYVPGLLKRVFAGDPLPKIELFTSKDLFPDVLFDAPRRGETSFPVRVINRGGGIGQVQVLVNGKEIVRDARPAKFDQLIREATFIVDLKDAPLRAEGENRIEIVARNAAGSLTNRGSPRGESFVRATASAMADPNIYLIAAGVSDYAAGNLSLNFAAKDAEDFARAVEVGATKLLKGDKRKVHVRLLTSNATKSSVKFNVPDAKLSTATKADFERAFADFKTAGPDDVFIVYLAGHGTTINPGDNPAGNTYLYLTQEATTTDRTILSIDSTRRAMTVSSFELKEMMKQNKALKQVLILDTCAAGAASGSFVAKRDVPGDQIGALERLKDNTGFYILMGSAADAVSYEASQYGQGLLTYSLLQAMKGARLREDQFADVELLFGYAKDTVGLLAKNIGGIQRPETITPNASRSFDIGEFSELERRQINTLARPVSLILRPRLTNPKLRFDNLGLEKILRSELRRASLVTTGVVPKLMFVESDEMPDAYLPSGDYSVDGDVITVKLVLVKNEQPLAGEITVTGRLAEKEELIRRLIAQIVGALG